MFSVPKNISCIKMIFFDWKLSFLTEIQIENQISMMSRPKKTLYVVDLSSIKFF